MAELKHLLLALNGSDNPPPVVSMELISSGALDQVDALDDMNIMAVGWLPCTERAQAHKVLDQTLDALEALPTQKNDGPYSDEPDMV